MRMVCYETANVKQLVHGKMNSHLPENCLYPNDAFLIFNSNRPNQVQPFVIDLHLQYRLKRKHHVLLILLANDAEHTNSVAAKLGVNLNMFKQNSTLDYVDLFDMMKNDSEPDVDWQLLTTTILNKIEKLPENSIVMIDD